MPLTLPALREEHSWGNPGASNQGHQKSLAQPMGQKWAQKWQYALEEDLVQKSLKTLRQENDEKKKRTCDILIWFQVGVSCNALWKVDADSPCWVEWTAAN